MIFPRFCGHCFSSCSSVYAANRDPRQGRHKNRHAHAGPRMDDRHRVHSDGTPGFWMSLAFASVWCSKSMGLRYAKLEWRRRGL